MSQHDIPRPEYPRPQMTREAWMNLNGEWEFEIDQARSGKSRGLYRTEHLSGHILVPFCPESSLSGVGNQDFMSCVWYRREVELPPDWMEDIRRNVASVYLHIGAVDYSAALYVNGEEAGSHRGGYTPFTADITAFLKEEGPQVVTVCAEDDVRSHRQPAGKQCAEYASHGCFYTRTTGIWQTVWLEKAPKNHIRSFRIYPDAENASVRIHVEAEGAGSLEVSAFYGGRLQGTAKTYLRGEGDVVLTLAEKHLWEPGAGRLYDLCLVFEEDRVGSYFGLRSVRLEGMKFLINGRSVFQRLVLDQGFYPDGIYTAPTAQALLQDIELSLAAGFNGARLHEKVFDPLFLYYCDRMGYLVWGEYANWGMDVTDAGALAVYLPEWLEAVDRDFNHPSIIGWCPFNETWDFEGRKQCDDVLRLVWQMTKRTDPTRPCIDTSGNYHVETDIFDLHDYDQDPDAIRERYRPLAADGVLADRYSRRQRYGGQPVFISEYGGIKWDPEGGENGWGYGNGPKTEEEFIGRYRGLTQALLDNEKLFGFCYTQLYDVEQERNGLYTYHRVPKFDMDVIKKINSGPAAIERPE